ncbi:MAG: hypothetical protein ABSB29_00625 [Nitrososphaerales archaeon]|jgi:hypothetical protein
MSEDDLVVVRLPKELVERISREMGQRFVSTDDSVVFLLERALGDEAIVPTPQAEFSAEEKKALEERLRLLGY